MATNTGDFASRQTIYRPNSKGVKGKWHVYGNGRRVFLPSRRESVTPIAEKPKSGSIRTVSTTNSQNSATSSPTSTSGFSPFTQEERDRLAAQDPNYVSSVGVNAYNASTGFGDLNYGTRSNLVDLGVNDFSTQVINGPGGNPLDTDPTKPGVQTATQVVGGPIDYNSVDVTNPFSRAGLLVKSYRSATTGTNNQMAAAGQRNSGANLRGQLRNSFNFSQGQNAIERSYADTMANQERGIRGLVGSFLQQNNAAMTGVQRPQIDDLVAGGAIPQQGTFFVGNDQIGLRAQAKAQGIDTSKAGWQKLVSSWIGNGLRIKYVDGKPVGFVDANGNIIRS